MSQRVYVSIQEPVSIYQINTKHRILFNKLYSIQTEKLFLTWNILHAKLGQCLAVYSLEHFSLNGW